MVTTNRLAFGIMAVMFCSALFALSPTSTTHRSRYPSTSDASKQSAPAAFGSPSLATRGGRAVKSPMIGELTIGGVGDIMTLSIYEVLARRGGFHGYIDGVAHVWRERADVTLANLEMVISNIDVWGDEHEARPGVEFHLNRSIFSAAQNAGFNLPAAFLKDIVEAGGFKLLVTANLPAPRFLHSRGSIFYDCNFSLTLTFTLIVGQSII